MVISVVTHPFNASREVGINTIQDHTTFSATMNHASTVRNPTALLVHSTHVHSTRTTWRVRVGL